MRIRILPVDTRLGDRSLEQIATKIHQGLSFSPVSIKLCKRTELHGIYDFKPHPLTSYRELLVEKYPLHTLALTSRPLLQLDPGETEPREYVGMSWISDQYAVASTRQEFTDHTIATRAAKIADTAQTGIHEILHWADINHHRKPQFNDGRYCVMTATTNPWTTAYQPCRKCQGKFDAYIAAQMNRR